MTNRGSAVPITLLSELFWRAPGPEGLGAFWACQLRLQLRLTAALEEKSDLTPSVDPVLFRLNRFLIPV